MLAKSWSTAYPSKHDTLTQCWLNVRPPSPTLAQHSPRIGSMYCVCWVYATSTALRQHLIYNCGINSLDSDYYCCV